ncbi:MAG: class I SAM-dependent methyltransferase [Vicinamibacteria bacterium]
MSWRDLIPVGDLQEGQGITLGSREYILVRNILRQKSVYSASQDQTKTAFGFKWAKRDTYESPTMLANHKQWMIQRYLGGRPELLDQWVQDGALVLDAGCGASYSGLEFFETRLNHIQYLGVDISEAVDVAVERFRAAGKRGEFMQADILDLPFSGPTFDMIFSEGVLHHTDSTQGALSYLAGLLKPGGRFLFYVYRVKGPIREFSDDHIREVIKGMGDEEAWEALVPLTKLGQALGELNVKVKVPEAVPYLGIPAGEIDIQRLFYWYVFKAFYRSDWQLEEMNHINFDWYRPQNCHRQTPEDVTSWCAEVGLAIDHMDVQESGITVVGLKGT